MSVLILASGALGPFKTVETLDDRLRCDGVDYCFSVIGEYQVSEDDSLAPPPPEPPRNILTEIAEIESTITNRRQREAILGVDNGWLAAQDVKIAELRKLL